MTISIISIWKNRSSSRSSSRKVKNIGSCHLKKMTAGPIITYRKLVHDKFTSSRWSLDISSPESILMQISCSCTSSCLTSTCLPSSLSSSNWRLPRAALIPWMRWIVALILSVIGAVDLAVSSFSLSSLSLLLLNGVPPEDWFSEMLKAHWTELTSLPWQALPLVWALKMTSLFLLVCGMLMEGIEISYSSVIPEKYWPEITSPFLLKYQRQIDLNLLLFFDTPHGLHCHNISMGHTGGQICSFQGYSGSYWCLKCSPHYSSTPHMLFSLGFSWRHP